MKYILFPLLFILFAFQEKANGQKPIQSEAMYYQLRSMETGPWDFRPKAYYYSWVTKKILFFKTKVPGLGVHDKGPGGIGVTGDGYVNKYRPSSQLRAQMFALSQLTLKQYEAIEKEYKLIGDREALDVADRQVDVAIQIYKEKIKNLGQNINTLLMTHQQLTGSFHLDYQDELQRIESNISMISKSYTRNGERSSAYLKEIKNLEKLYHKILRSCERAHAFSNIKNINLTTIK